MHEYFRTFGSQKAAYRIHNPGRRVGPVVVGSCVVLIRARAETSDPHTLATPSRLLPVFGFVPHAATCTSYSMTSSSASVSADSSPWRSKFQCHERHPVLLDKTDNQHEWAWSATIPYALVICLSVVTVE